MYVHDVDGTGFIGGEKGEREHCCLFDLMWKETNQYRSCLMRQRSWLLRTSYFDTTTTHNNNNNNNNT